MKRLKRFVMRFLLNWIMRDCHHAQTLSDGTKVVRMSDEFHEWVYSEGYKQWKNGA